MAKTLFCTSLLYRSTMEHKRAVAEFCGNVELCNHTARVVFSDPYRVSQYNHWTSPYLDRDVEAVTEDNCLKIEIAELKSQFCERGQALIHGDLHTGSVMVTLDSTQVIDPEFVFYGPMGFDIGAFLGNLILAYFAQDGHANQRNDRKSYKEWILRTLEETWTLFHKKFTALWDQHKGGSGEAYIPEIYNNPEIQQLAQQKFMKDLFHDTLRYGAAKMIRIGGLWVWPMLRILNQLRMPENEQLREQRALEFAKMLLKERRKFQAMAEVVSAIPNLHL
ncbi:hypothetical protein Patl1_35400 [Pistacia atlantica]|nr:hypothetical protein Patl1_35400 [Pistacia atlantica]